MSPVARSKRSIENEIMSLKELNDFMKLHGISDKELSEIFGVTIQAVKLWLNGQREFSVTNSRLVRMFNKYPQLIREF
jgi:transcriptional regulator with XRE-family HTH domain